MRYLIVITVLLGIGYSQCNESNWQEYYNSEGHNMQGCDLSDAYFINANLTYADLSYADLSGATLQWGTFLGSNFSYADLSGATLQGTNFDSTNFSYANFSGASLDGASFDLANFSCANLSWTSLDAISFDNTIWCECGFTDENGDGYDDVSYAAGLLLSTQIVISVTEGWNMISSLPNSVNVDDIQDPNGVIPTNGIYGYEDGSYTVPSVLSPGEGYWLRALGDGEITLNSSNNG